MFEDYYFDDPALQDALAAAGYYTDPVRAPAVMPSTVEAEPIMGIGSPAVAAATTGARAPLTFEQLAAVVSPGRDPSQREQIIASQNLVSTPYSINNFLEYGNGQGIAGGAPTTTGLYAGHNYTLVDNKTDTVLAQGSTPEAIQKIQDIANNLNVTQGQDADWRLYDSNPQSGITNMHEKMPGAYLDLSAPGDPRGVVVAGNMPNDIFKDYVGPILGTMGPLIASAFIPGLNLSPLGSIAAGAGIGGAGAGLRGENILEGAAIGGLGAAGGQLLGPGIPGIGKVGDLGLRVGTAIGTGLGSAAGGLLTGQNLKDAVTGGVVSGGLSYLTPDVAKGLGIGGGPSSSSTSTSGGDGYTGITVNATPAITPSSIGYTLGGSSPSKLKLPEAQKPEVPYDGLTVSGNRIGNAFGVNLGGNQFGAPGSDTSAFERLTDTADPSEILVRATPAVQAAPVSVPITGDVRAGIAEFAKNPIIAEGSKIERPGTGNINLDLALLDRLAGMENYTDEIVVDGSRIERPAPVAVSAGPPLDPLPPLNLKADPALTEKPLLEKIKDAANIANLASTLIPIAGGVLGGGGGGSTLPPDTTRLNFTTNPLRPTTPGIGIGGIGGRYPYTPTTYGRAGGDQETEYMFFTRDPLTGAPMAPVTVPAAPAMVAPSGNAFAEGGEVDDDMVKHLVDYHKNGGHQGPGQVKGIGSGQEDKIPAYLSDGEYVWSAQDVSDLGDGSNREGVRRLDKMRQMVRSQAGRKDVKKIAKPQKGIDRMLKAVGGMA